MDRANSGGPAAPAPQDGAGREPPRKKKKKVSVGRTILGIIGRIILTLFTLCVIGVLTVGIFALGACAFAVLCQKLLGK